MFRVKVDKGEWIYFYEFKEVWEYLLRAWVDHESACFDDSISIERLKLEY